MPEMLRSVRAMLRRTPLLANAVRHRRGRAVDREYTARRERYAAATPGLFADERERARTILRSRWTGPRRRVPRSAEARLFIVAAQWEAASPWVPELLRNYDTVLFDISSQVPRLGDPNELAWRGPLQAEIIERFMAAERERPVDAALLYVSHYECAPATLERLARTGIPVLVLSMDDKHAFDERAGGVPNGQRPLIGAATLHLTNSVECLRWYAAFGAAAYFFPEGADPEIYRPLGLPKDIDVSFLGGWYGGRRRLIERLRAYGIQIETYGPHTDHGPITRKEIVRLFDRSRVNLGFGGVNESARVTCLKGRDFEVPMAGGLYLTQYNWELTQLYDVGREIACYLNEEDCAEQIRLLLEDDDRASAMRQAARARALRDHTWSRRMDDLLGWLGILGT